MRIILEQGSGWANAAALWEWREAEAAPPNGWNLLAALEGEESLSQIVPGQPRYQLVLWRVCCFDLQGSWGFSIEFRKDGLGQVTG